MRQLRAAWVGVCGAILSGLTGCALMGVPGLFLNPKGTYTASPVVIPYTFNGPAGSAWCRYALYKVAPGPSPATLEGAAVTRQLDSSGNLVLDIAAMTGSSVIDGNYQVLFSVLGGSSGQTAIPTLTQSVDFSVQTQPYLQSTTPEVINTSVFGGSLSLSGWNFGSSPTVTSTPAGSLSWTSVTPGGSNQITLSGVAAAASGSLVVNDGSTSSPAYLVPVVAGPISSSISVQPSSGNITSAAFQLVIQGANFTPYTSIDFVDANGNAVPFTVTAESSTYFVLRADLRHAARGNGSITLNSNDGLTPATSSQSAPVPFFING